MTAMKFCNDCERFVEAYVILTDDGPGAVDICPDCGGDNLTEPQEDDWRDER